jgi:hypothetical protein
VNKLIITVTMNMQTGEVLVYGPLDQKPLVCNALARAITAVIEHVPPVILPAGHANGNGNGNGALKS